MKVLYALESIRMPWLDTVMAAITHLGEETVFMVAALFVFWCVSKRHGYYLLAIGFAGTVLNQFLKLLFRIPRPWVLDSDFTIVESARAQATGYSFPSGHSQNAIGTGVMGGTFAATALGIFFVPVFFVLVFRLFNRKAREGRGTADPKKR